MLDDATQGPRAPFFILKNPKRHKTHRKSKKPSNGAPFRLCVDTQENTKDTNRRICGSAILCVFVCFVFLGTTRKPCYDWLCPEFVCFVCFQCFRQWLSPVSRNDTPNHTDLHGVAMELLHTATREAFKVMMRRGGQISLLSTTVSIIPGIPVIKAAQPMADRMTTNGEKPAPFMACKNCTQAQKPSNTRHFSRRHQASQANKGLPSDCQSPGC